MTFCLFSFSFHIINKYPLPICEVPHFCAIFGDFTVEMAPKNSDKVLCSVLMLKKSVM